MSHLLELNDWHLSCYTPRGQCIYQQAAAAFAQADQLVFGDQALAQSRIQPQTFNVQYLSRLSTETLPRKIGPAQNYADLIYYHLRSIQSEHTLNDLVIAAPAYYSDEQLGLLLGIADEAGLNIQGFVDSALGYAIQTRTDTQHIFDIGLNQSNLSELRVKQGQIHVGSYNVFEGNGILGIVDAWLHVIASAFLQTSRFDPLHSAATEQQVFDQALGWITQGLPSDPQVSLDVDGHPRKADIPHAALISALRQRLSIAEFTNITTLGLTPRTNSVPGLNGLLSEISGDVVNGNANPKALLAAHEPHTGTGPNRILQSAHSASANSAVQATPNPRSETETSGSPATHLLADHQATALTADALSTYFDADGLLRPGAEVLINGTAPTSARLRCGDDVQLPDGLWVAIRISD